MEAKKKEQEKEEKKRKERIQREKEREAEEKRKELEAKKAAAGEEDVMEIGEDGTFDVGGKTTEKKMPPTPPPSSSTTEKKEDDAPAEEEEEDKSPPPEGNGGTTDKYKWTQTLQELSVTFTLPIGTKAKMIDIDIKNTKLKVGIKGETPIVDGTFHKSIICEDSFWTIEDSRYLVSKGSNKYDVNFMSAYVYIILCLIYAAGSELTETEQDGMVEMRASR